MAVEPFNSFGGYSTGIPPVQVIDSNGNVVTNVNYPAGNVTANRVFANTYLFANGQPLTISPAGANTQVQFNNQGNFGATSTFTFNSTLQLLSTLNLTVTGNTNLGSIDNITILGGDNGYFLQTDGTGNLTWAPSGGGNGGNGNPGGANTQVQYNDSGSFGGDPGFTYNEITNTLNVQYITAETITANLNGTASDAIIANVVRNNAQPNITSVGTLTGLTMAGNIIPATSNLYSIGNASRHWNQLYVGSDGINVGNAQIKLSTTSLSLENGNSNVVIDLNGNIKLSSKGQLEVLTISDDRVTIDGSFYVTENANINGLLSAGNVTTSGTVFTTNINVTSSANIAAAGTLRVLGNVNFSNASIVNLGPVENVKITGGINGYVLTTDGTGNLIWSASGAGGNGTPGGSNTQIQYNKNGTFGGSPNLTFNDATNNVTVAGNLIANSLTMGSGVYEFCYSNIFSATTNSLAPNQLLLAIPADSGVGSGTIVAVDYTIISTDNIIRNFVKISCVRSGSTLNYVEYSTIPVNGYTGDFKVEFNEGNVINPASIQLTLSPQSANLMTHKMMVTAYFE